MIASVKKRLNCQFLWMEFHLSVLDSTPKILESNVRFKS